jgi:hypothetical protein
MKHASAPDDVGRNCQAASLAFVAAVCSKALHPAGGGAMFANDFNELGGKWLGNLDSNQD